MATYFTANGDAGVIQELLRQLGQIFTWIVIVAPWEQALRIRCGRHVRLLTAGIYLRIPFIDRVYRNTIRRRLSPIRPQTLTTADGHVVTLAAALGYSIADLRKLFNTLDHAEDTLESEASSRIADYVGKHSLAECKASTIEEHVRGVLDLTKYGLAGQEFFVVNFAAVKTYRLISGELPSWRHGTGLDTTQHDQSK